MGLHSRGGFEIKELVWKDGHLTHAEIHSTLGDNVSLRCGDQITTRPTQVGRSSCSRPDA